MDNPAVVLDMNTSLRESYNFFLGHAVPLLPFVRRTAYRWIKENKLCVRQLPDKRYLISLDEINRVREEYAMEPVSKAQALEFWETW